MSNDPQAPRRLLQTVGPAGDCVREALAQRELPQAPPRFALLQERRVQRVRRQRGFSLLALVAVAGLGARLLQREEPASNIRAELVTPSTRAAASSLPNELPVAPESALPSKVTGPTLVALKPPAPRASAEASARANDAASPASAANAASDATETAGTAKACAQLARAGTAEQARDCYEKLSSGSGMSAELALFEQARLEGKALRRPERALLTLEAYRRRFPQGSLRAEVMLAQVDWLLATGDSVHALQVVDEALASGLLRERTAELERLQATLKPAHD